jgi:hypothetical protein
MLGAEGLVERVGFKPAVPFAPARRSSLMVPERAREIRTVAELKGACKGSLAPGSHETAVAARKGLPFAR